MGILQFTAPPKALRWRRFWAMRERADGTGAYIGGGNPSYVAACLLDHEGVPHEDAFAVMEGLRVGQSVEVLPGVKVCRAHDSANKPRSWRW